jgi:hypothetical protein
MTRFHWCKACRVAVDPVSKRGTEIPSEDYKSAQDPERESVEDE